MTWDVGDFSHNTFGAGYMLVDTITKRILCQADKQTCAEIASAHNAAVAELRSALHKAGCMYHDQQDADKEICCCQGCSQEAYDYCDCPRCVALNTS